MVRLFVPEGEGQHPLARRLPDPLPAQLTTTRVPTISVVLACATTAVLALVGHSRPGYFLKAVAYSSAANLSVAGVDGFGRREVNRAIFKLDSIEPKPGKLWERTKHWTHEDVGIGGAMLFTFTALNPRALPGVSGWRRFLGAATLGFATGINLGPGYFALARIPPQSQQLMQTADAYIRKFQYDRLKEDPKAQENLSRFGKIAFRSYTWPIWGLSLNPFRAASEPEAGHKPGVLGGGFQPGQLTQDAHAGTSEDEMEQYDLIQIEFGKRELRGPDVEHGYRAYKEHLADRDTNALHDWLEQLEENRRTTATEAQYVWQYLAIKEHAFYTMEEEDREKDIARRELQLLNNMASDFTSRDAILAYHIADVQKRLAQPGKQEPVTQNLIIKTHAMPEMLPEDWKVRHSPRMVAEHTRINWSRQKELLGYFERSSSMFGDVKPEPGSAQAKQLDGIKQNAEMMKKNVEATERLLKDFEDQIRRAEEYADAEEPRSAGH